MATSDRTNLAPMNTLTHLRFAALYAAAVISNSSLAISPNDIKPEKELLITHPALMDGKRTEYPGPWSFGTLMAELAGNDGRELVKKWLDTMLPKEPGAPPAAGPEHMIPPRPNFAKLIIEPWQRRDGYDPKAGEPWLPKLENAPFRLLAIVNRMDLGAPSNFSSDSGGGGWAGGGPANLTNLGEGRMVFCAVTDSGNPLPGGWTVIFEYKLARLPEPIAPAAEVGALARRERRAGVPYSWAKEWHALADYELTDERFAIALERITRAFTHKGPILGQLRSNDGAFGPGRVFRQYERQGASLVPQKLSGTPGPAFMDKSSREGRALAAFLREQEPLIRAGSGDLPASLQSNGASYETATMVAFIPDSNPSFHWDLAAPREARRLFSLSTCNGCHAGETATASGMHIHPRSIGEASRLSDWLAAGSNGLRVDDPGFKNSRVDLREMQDRKEILAALLDTRVTSRSRDLQEILRDRLKRSH
jgi:hypothetical protein